MMTHPMKRAIKDGRGRLTTSRNRRRKSAPLMVEAMEGRVLLATRIWDGFDAFLTNDFRWSEPTNWTTNIAPVDGDDVVFPAAFFSQNNVNDIVGLDLNGITFTGTGYNLPGNGVTINTGIGIQNNSGGNNTVSLAGVAVTVNTQFANSTAGSNLFIGSPISGSGVTLTKNGPGAVRYTQSPVGNSFSGTTLIADGPLELAGIGNNTIITGPLVIGNGAGAAGSASVSLINNNQIGVASPTTINSDGILQVNDRNESIGATTINPGGQIDVGTGNFELFGVSNLTAGTIFSSFNAGTLFLPFTVNVNASGTPSVIGSFGTTIDVSQGGGQAPPRVFNVANGGAVDDLQIFGNLTNGSVDFTGPGRVLLGIISQATLTAPISVDAGETLVVDGSVSNVNGGVEISLNGGVLKGAHQFFGGTTGDIQATPAGGTVAPGDNPNGAINGQLNTGNIDFNAATTLLLKLDGPVPGFQYDQLNVTGTVNLGNATLTLQPGFTPGTGTTFILINNDGPDSINGVFANFPNQNTPVIINGVQYFITYFGGDGNDVALTVNSAPSAINDFYALAEDTVLFVPPPGVLGNDSDPNGDTLLSILVTSPTNGTLVLNGDGSFTYTPTAGFNGIDSFTYYATDGYSVPNPPPGSPLLNTNIATVTLFVNAVQQQIVTQPDTYASNQVASITVPAGQGVLANDYSPDGKALTVNDFDPGAGVDYTVFDPQNGTVVLNADGSFTYTPNPGFTGSDSFGYQATDGNFVSGVTVVTLNVTAQNRPPVGVADVFGAAEDLPLFVAAPGVLGNDSDPDLGDTLSAFLVTAPTNGTLTLNADGSFTYTPKANFFGADSFTYSVSDGTLSSAPVTVTINVAPVSDAPTANNDSYQVSEDQTLNIAAPGILVNDINPDGGVPAITVVNQPQNGTVTVNANGSFVYTPNANYFGPDSFTYFLTNAGLNSNVATVSLIVLPVPDAPVGNADAFTVSEDQTLTVAASGVLANDVNVDGDTLSAVLITGPTNGSLVLNSDGSFTYTPNLHFNGTDTFTYQPANSSLPGNVTTVTLTVSAVADNPTAGDDFFTTQEDLALTIVTPGILINDTNPDGGTPAITVFNGPQHGTLALNADGSFTYTPNANFEGVDSFTYFLTSAANLTSNVATVTIVVEAVPDAPGEPVDDAYSVPEDTPLVVSAPGVLANDNDNDGPNTLSAVVVNAPANGTLTLNSDGSFLYVPFEHFFGNDSFTYRVTDGTFVSGTATVSIAVNPVADTPTAGNDAYTGQEDIPIIVAAPGILVNDTNPDGGTPTISVVNGPQHGTLALNANGSFTYTPNANYFGPDSFTYFLTSAAGLDSNVATVSLTVEAVPDAPVGNADAYTTLEDGVLIVPTAGVLINDVNVDLDTLTSVLVDGPTNGSLLLNSDGSFTYIPNDHFNGTDTFSYRPVNTSLEGNVTTVTITVTAVAEESTPVDDAFTTLEDQPLTIAAPAILLNDLNPDGGTPTITVQNGPQFGTLTVNADGSFTYTPNANFFGTDSFTYFLTSATGVVSSSAATVTLTVLAVPEAPVGAADTYSTAEDNALIVSAPGVLINDTNVDLDTLSAVLINGPANGTLTLNSDGSFVYVPNADFNGTDSFTYRPVNTSLEGGVTTVTISVTPVSEASTPIADAFTTLEDQPLTIAPPAILLNDLNPDGGTPTITIENGPQFGTLVVNADGSFTYTPNANFNGTDSFTYYLTSATGVISTVSAPVTITVLAVNDLPVANADTYTTQEDQPLIVGAPGVLGNDTDIDGDILTAVLVQSPARGTLTLNADGSFVYTPNLHTNSALNGDDSFTYFAFDGEGNSNTVTVTIVINPVAEAPVGFSDAYALQEGATLTVGAAQSLRLNDFDPDALPGDVSNLVVSQISAAQHGTVALNPDGTFTYTPFDPNFNGTDSFTYQLTNASGLRSAVTTVSLTIVPVNDPPVANPDTYTTPEDTPLVVLAPGVLGNDTDIDLNTFQDTLSAILVQSPTRGSLSLNADGSFIYTPLPNVNSVLNGNDTFTYIATDGQGNSGPVTVTIIITPVADAPVAVNDAYVLQEDTPLTISPAATGSVRLNDLDPDSLPGVVSNLTVNVVSQPQHGTLALNLDGTFTYTPAANYNGPDSFSYQVTNLSGLRSNVATVSLTVVSVPDPAVGNPDFYQVPEDQILTVPARGVLFNDVNVDNDTLTAVIENAPANGTLVLNSDGSFIYTPNANFFGTDTFTYRPINTTQQFPGAPPQQFPGNPTTVTITVTPVNDAPVSADDFYSTERDERLVVPAPGVLGNDFDIENNTNITAVLVNTTQNGTLVLNADGSFVYTPNPQFRGEFDRFTYRTRDAQGLLGNVATVLIRLIDQVFTTVQLDPASDTGVSNTDRITNDNTPTFFGVTDSNLTLRLYAQPVGSAGAPTQVGITTADGAGNYTVTSSPLADGNWQFFVEAFRADGLSTGRINAGTVLIDTVAPKVAGSVLQPRTGQIYVTMFDDRSGLVQASLANRNNYSFSRLFSNTPRVYAITSATVIANNGPAVPQTVALTSALGRRILHGRYLFQIVSSGVTDVAGNALDGEFTGTFPSGNGLAGGNFNALFLTNGQTIVPPTATSLFIPFLTGPGSKIGPVPGLKTPIGPITGPGNGVNVNGAKAAKKANVAQKAPVIPAQDTVKPKFVRSNGGNKKD